MPSYPDSVKSFTNKASGQNIDPAHVNDIQDEVNAIEAGLLNGTARLNSSGSTMVRLQVTGGSTLTTLNVTGGSTITTLQAAGSSFSVRPVEPPPDAALVFLASSYTAGSSAASTLSFLAQGTVVNSSMHSTTTNPSRLTPQSTGLYEVAAQVTMDGVATAGQTPLRAINIVDSTGTRICGVQVKSSAADQFNLVGYKYFDVTGGWVNLTFISDGTSTHSLSSGLPNTWFTLRKL